MISQVRNVYYMAAVMRAAEIFHFRLIRIRSNAGNSIYYNELSTVRLQS